MIKLTVDCESILASSRLVDLLYEFGPSFLVFFKFTHHLFELEMLVAQDQFCDLLPQEIFIVEIIKVHMLFVSCKGP
jgi:hypothetical protein